MNTSDQIAGNYSTSMSVSSHPVRKGQQLVAEVRVREGSTELLSMSPAAARDLAAALLDAADQAEGSR